MTTRKHDPDAAIGWLLIVVTMSTLLLILMWCSGCTHVTDCPPVTVPDEVLLPIAAPCEKLPVVEIPDRESAGWTAEQIRECVACYLSALARDYLALWDAHAANQHALVSHNEACYDSSVNSDD